MHQEIQFCTTADNVNIAYASVGSGPPFVKAANWMNHLELDWQSPVWRHLLEEFSLDHQLVRYDERGTGLSDRAVADLSLDAFVSDLEAVVDAAQIDQFPLLGISQGGPVAIAYAVRNPEKVSHLILFGSFAAGWKKSSLPADVLEKRFAQVSLIRQGWGSKNPAFRQFWTTLCIPDGHPDETASFNELQKASASAENAARIFEAIGDFDVSDLLPELEVPVLILHSREDATVPFEEGRRLASAMRNARFVTLESRDHILLSHEPSWQRFVREVRNFIGRDRLNIPDSDPTRLLKVCSACGKFYGEEMRFCLDDGTPLG